jgi:hypothetical protein
VIGERTAHRQACARSGARQTGVEVVCAVGEVRTARLEQTPPERHSHDSVESDPKTVIARPQTMAQIVDCRSQGSGERCREDCFSTSEQFLLRLQE